MSNEENQKFELISNSPEETSQLGETIAAKLTGGEVICFIGPLGSGKTCLIKGISRGLKAFDAEHVNSPTFVLINEYSGPDCAFDIYHIDAYRLNSIAEFEMLGFDDLCYRRSIVLIEWADKVQSALNDIDCIKIELAHITPTQRKIKIKNLKL